MHRYQIVRLEKGSLSARHASRKAVLLSPEEIDAFLVVLLVTRWGVQDTSHLEDHRHRQLIIHKCFGPLDEEAVKCDCV
jgi:hypothetical protein